MNSMPTSRGIITCIVTLLAGACVAPAAAASKPNFVFILADDLGYGDLGCYGQEKIQTPHLDRMAAGGMRFTDYYAGSTVCAPSRCVLMTGQDTGHCWVRGNARGPAATLRPKDITVAEKLKQAGYRTALVGKWGLGDIGSTGHPQRQGFDFFYGYLNQRHAHNYYPSFLVRGEKKEPLRNIVSPKWKEMRRKSNAPDDGAGFATPDGRLDYSHDLIMDEALGWLRESAASGEPFFLYLALTIPHANNEGKRGTGDGQEVPDYGIYADKDWPDPDKGQAAMITRMDRDVGRLLDLLAEAGVAKDTLVFFSSDNGHHREGGNNPDFFDANGPLRGMKRNLTEGGIRVPGIAWWPGAVEAGTESAHVSGFVDFMATACDLAGVEPPADTQSISMVPTLKGNADGQGKHDFLYWEFYEAGSKQAVRFGDWKAIRKPMFTGPIQLYNLAEDLGETTDLAAKKPDIAARARGYLAQGHTPNPNWSVRRRKK